LKDRPGPTGDHAKDGNGRAATQQTTLQSVRLWMFTFRETPSKRVRTLLSAAVAPFAKRHGTSFCHAPRPTTSPRQHRRHHRSQGGHPVLTHPPFRTSHNTRTERRRVVVCFELSTFLGRREYLDSPPGRTTRTSISLAELRASLSYTTPTTDPHPPPTRARRIDPLSPNRTRIPLPDLRASIQAALHPTEDRPALNNTQHTHAYLYAATSQYTPARLLGASPTTLDVPPNLAHSQTFA
jgi:hypothetical protein